MFSFVMPLRAIMLQGLLLLLAIAIESFVFQKRWRLSRKTSIDYAMAINLFSTVVGWALFFIIQPFLPTDLKQQIVNYVFFNYFKNLSTSPNSFLHRANRYYFRGVHFEFYHRTARTQFLAKSDWQESGSRYLRTQKT
jgi:hypothetical protein